MKTVDRVTCIIVGNIVWLTLFIAAIAIVAAPDYVAWWQREGPNFQRGCDEDTFRYDVLDRLYIFGLIWLLSTPLMNLFAWRIPENWPHRLSHLWWNGRNFARSLATAVVSIAFMLWPLIGLVNAPVASTLLLEMARAILLLGVLLYYRAILLSS